MLMIERQFKNTVTKAVTDALNKQPTTNANAYVDPFKDYEFGDNNSEAK